MAGRSPPRHRHDGSSPLPLGIDASPAPARWDGPQTVWPHDPRTGWSYCVFIPSWVVIPEAKDSDGKPINPTVFFKVQVGIQSPDGISTLRQTLRRFSDFLKLHAALKKLFSKKKLPAPPPKNSLMRINSKQPLLQERRHALEEWMGSLLADIDISRSVPLASFLELEVAVRAAATSISERQSQLNVTNNLPLQTTRSLRSRASWTGGGSSVVSGGYSTLDYGSDVAYENSVVGTPSKGSEGGLEIEMEALSLEEQAAIIATSGDSRVNQQQERNTSVGLARSYSEEVGAMIQSRGEFKDNVVTDELLTRNEICRGEGELAGASLDGTSLKSPLGLGPRHRRRTSQESLFSEISSAPESELYRGVSMDVPSDHPLWSFSAVDSSGDPNLTDVESLKGVGLVFPADQRSKVKRVMGTLQRRIVAVKTDMEDLLARLNQETAVKEFLTTKVRDLEGELDGMRRKSREVLQQAVWAERERMTSLQWELDDCRVALQSSEETVQSLQASKAHLEERLEEALAKCEMTRKELVDVRQLFHSRQQEEDTVDAQARAEKKVLTKEVKNLRASHMEIKQEAKQAMQTKAILEASLSEEKQKQEKAQITRAKFVHEIAVLRARLQECNMDELRKRGGSLGRTEASDMLSTLESRISLLIGQAQLLVEEDEELCKLSSSTNRSLLQQYKQSIGDSEGTVQTDQGSDAILRKMLIDTFIEEAQLCKSINSLTCNAITSRGSRKLDLM
ncbi:PX domain-containing protein EREL1 [Physcomitrium patens]|uniref:PX domain-containing protein n=1 Tax=Physcomitrium patens TaxID=3218 RepID=A0A2K1L2J5_PHYPA|nr:PX domain-containing protein EREL1-like [Physcomitrium patens]PNR60247.1 hypothetical protein PHYPA_003040 [Physcomitrium patens]|eukprot:XP_024399637.1 PX domain-containing protein EREL1-like [Physcomitrella patens]